MSKDTNSATIKHVIHEGFVAGLADKELQKLLIWNGNPHVPGSHKAALWTEGFALAVAARNVVGGQVQLP